MPPRLEYLGPQSAIAYDCEKNNYCNENNGKSTDDGSDQVMKNETGILFTHCRPSEYCASERESDQFYCE